ncbi:hypothetical protein CHLRE_05g244450v5 [Chlamydomonas reinhardtii]|uniref:Uncharacterized protein n=1 Tax=Chlamydomonas reinhardtii TaxID=3055 RepID=A0A2K3DS85_CHLRE|nr:uncharacterized protein CHLRE_05g244450v5 [Chlamydomonas reinhardtii]PNW83404.1 hypothetical protein CHLRE_05g244450v5 [Chlamydomonas reinhardtii]
MDAVNQLPRYLVRGEQGGAFHHLWLAARQLQTGLRKSRDYSSAVARLAAKWQQQGQAQEQGQGQAQEQAHQQGREQGKQEGRRRRVHIRHRQLQEAFGESGRGSGRGRLVGEEAGAGEGGGGVTALVPAGWDESRLDFGTVKAIYDRHAPLKKLPWFNDFHPKRLADAARAFYATLYHYHLPGQRGQRGQQELVSGFKEIRFVSGRCFPPGSPYSDFAAFMAFLRSLCVDVKFLLNSRAAADLEANTKLAGMLRRFGHNVTADQLQLDLLTTHDWYDRYVAEHPDHALRVLMEHMFSPQESPALSERILRFLGEDPNQLPPLRFDRMPSWGARTKESRGQEGGREGDGEEEEEGEGERRRA